MAAVIGRILASTVVGFHISCSLVGKALVMTVPLPVRLTPPLLGMKPATDLQTDYYLFKNLEATLLPTPDY